MLGQRPLFILLEFCEESGSPTGLASRLQIWLRGGWAGGRGLQLALPVWAGLGTVPCAWRGSLGNTWELGGWGHRDMPFPWSRGPRAAHSRVACARWVCVVARVGRGQSCAHQLQGSEEPSCPTCQPHPSLAFFWDLCWSCLPLRQQEHAAVWGHRHGWSFPGTHTGVRPLLGWRVRGGRAVG